MEKSPAEEPPAYSELPEDSQPAVAGSATVTEYGRINVELDSIDPPLQAAIREELSKSETVPSETTSISSAPIAPPLNIVVMIVGSRGDVQPFMPLALKLREQGHRVRIATHPIFKTFVEEQGLDFFSIGGDPAALMAFMVKNPGLLPGVEALRNGDVSQRRHEIDDMIHRCWRACIDSGNGLESEKPDPDGPLSLFQMDLERPFVANAIIANPPSFAHIHCAERLSIPLHMVFTMPWSPTKYFSHPLANMRPSTVDKRTANYLSYLLVETIAWQGLGDLINDFRENVLGLNAMNPAWGPGVLERLKIPFTYCFSPALIPKPADWHSHISITGFNFLPTPKDYKPPDDLEKFLSDGPRPIYIGFGSIVVDDPNALTSLIISAVETAGVRAVISKGWGGIGSNLEVPPNLFLLGNCPHSWLFEHVSAVVHHGGAGTMAIGIACGKPTVIVPFFGDQPFWGDMVFRAGAGPRPIPFKSLTASNLAEAIQFAIQPQVAKAAQDLAEKINNERGAEAAVNVFNANLPHDDMMCDFGTGHVAVWRLKRKKQRLKISAAAMTILVRENLLTFEDVKLYRSQTYRQDPGAIEPISGSITASVGALSDFTIGFSHLSVGLAERKPSSKSTRALDSLPPTADATRGPQPSLSDTTISPLSSDPTLTPALSTTASSPTAGPLDHISIMPTSASNADTDQAQDRTPSRVRKGFKRLAIGTKASIVDIPLAFAQGLHNAPRLYGDKTVREPPKITGLGSGLSAAGKHLTLGLYDGVAGIFTQPVTGAREGGTAGFVKGFGKGLSGAVIKPLAGVSAVFAYPFKGVHKEVQRWGALGDNKAIRASLMTVGEEALLDAGVSAVVGSGSSGTGTGENMKSTVLRAWDELGLGDTAVTGERSRQGKGEGK